MITNLSGLFQVVVSMAGRVGFFIIRLAGWRLDFSDRGNSGHIGSI